MGTDGLAAFLELARLEEKLPEAADFCNQIGAIEVREVLEDEELCQELAEHLQLKPLELKRFRTLASEVSADRSFQLIDPEPIAPKAVAEAAPSPGSPVRAEEAVAPPTRSRLFASNSWAKPSRGKGRGTGPTGHYFDQGKTGSDSTVGSKHYWSAVEESRAPRVSANPYFGSLASEGICACGSSNVGRHMCFDCGRERQPPARQESQLESRQGDDHNTKVNPANQANQASQGRRFCIHCGAPQVAAAKFCSECGERCINPGAISQPEGAFQRRGGYFEKAPEPQHGAGVSKPEDEVDSFQDYKAQLRKEVLNAPATERGVGAYIRSLEGELWGRVVCDQGRSWQLASGRLARKENEGKVWVFENPNAIKAPKVVPEVTRQSSILDDLAEKRRQEEEALQAKREAARRRRREGDAGHQSQSGERRVDPDDNKLYTWEELRARYRGMFSDREVLDYWNKDCKVVPAVPAGRPKQGHHGHEGRKDPDDGKVYSFDELCRKYRGAFSLEEIEEYWLEECREMR